MCRLPHWNRAGEWCQPREAASAAPLYAMSIEGARLVGQEPALAVEAAGVARERPTRADHAVARHHDADGVTAVRHTHRPRRAGPADAPRDRAVGDGRAVGDVAQRDARPSAGTACLSARAAGRTRSALRRSTPAAPRQRPVPPVGPRAAPRRCLAPADPRNLRSSPAPATKSTRWMPSSEPPMYTAPTGDSTMS